MKRDYILDSLVEDTINELTTSILVYDPVVLKTQLNRALDIGTNHLKFQHPKCIRIQQLDNHNNEIDTFDSIREASRMTKIGRSSLNRAINNKQNTAGGYHWKKI